MYCKRFVPLQEQTEAPNRADTMAAHLSVAERIAIGFAAAIFTMIVFFIVPSLHKYIMYELESSVREIQPAAVRPKGIVLHAGQEIDAGSFSGDVLILLSDRRVDKQFLYGRR